MYTQGCLLLHFDSKYMRKKSPTGEILEDITGIHFTKQHDTIRNRLCLHVLTWQEGHIVHKEKIYKIIYFSPILLKNR